MNDAAWRVGGGLSFGDDGAIRDASEAAARWLGHDGAALRGRPLAEVLPDAAALLDELRRAGYVDAREVALRTRGGDTFAALLYAARAGDVSHAVFLPTRAPTRPPAPASPPPIAAGRRARILIIDDEPAVGRTLGRMLRAHEVVAAPSAADALTQIAAGARFDLVICDLMMPEMNGIEVHAAIGQWAPDLQARMVFMTGGAYTDDVEAFLRGVPNRVLAKPFHPEEVKAICEAVLAQAAK